MNQLHFDCSHTDVWVSPPNWRTISGKKALAANWYVQCDFYDPRFKDKYPKGKPWRKRLNKIKDVELRRAAARFLVEEWPRLLNEKGYNPITKEYRLPDPEPGADVLYPELTAKDAFVIAVQKIPGSENHKSEARIAVNRFVGKLNPEILIKDMRYRHFSDCMDRLTLTNNYYNKFRSYFIAVFKVLRKHECCSANLAMELDKKKVVTAPREVLEKEELYQVFDYLKNKYYSFYRYAYIFFCSGTRSTELFSIQKKHVRLDKQEYDVLVLKGSQPTWETKVILQNSLPFWKEIIEECSSADDYLFSKNLSPGETAIDPVQVSRRWRRLVKLKIAFSDGHLAPISELKKVGKDYTPITSDFYALKHTFLDLLDEMQSNCMLQDPAVAEAIANLDVDQSIKDLLLRSVSSSPDFDMAQRMAAHRSVAMTNKVYKVNKGKRDNEILKGLRLEL